MEISNFERAASASVGLSALLAIVEELPDLPASQLLDLSNELARTVLNAYAADTLHSPVLAFDGPTPLDEDRDEVASITLDFLADLRHLLDRHGLTVAAIHTSLPPSHSRSTTSELHNSARLARVCIRYYAQTVGLDFIELDDRAAARFAEEVAEEPGDRATVEPLPPRPISHLNPLDRYARSLTLLTRRLRRAITTRH